MWRTRKDVADQKEFVKRRLIGMEFGLNLLIGQFVVDSERVVVVFIHTVLLSGQCSWRLYDAAGTLSVLPEMVAYIIYGLGFLFSVNVPRCCSLGPVII